MASFLKKVQKGAQQVQKSAQQVHKSAKSGQLASNIKQSFNQAKSLAEEQIQDVLKVNYDKYLEKPVILEGKIWKRRGGMAAINKKSGESVWEMRRFELRGNALLYYALPPSDEEEIKFGGEDSAANLNAKSNDDFDGSDDSEEFTPPCLADSTWKDKSGSIKMSMDEEDYKTPRGHLDFKDEKALVHACPGQEKGAPSPFCLSIVTTTVVGMATHEKVKFMLSFDDQSNMMQWLTALSNVVTQCSVDMYNVQLVKASNPNQKATDQNIPFLRRPPVKEPPKKEGAIQEAKQIQSASHVLWIAHNNYYIWFKDDDDEENGDATTTLDNNPPQEKKISPAALQQMEKQHQTELKAVMATQDTFRAEIEKQVAGMEAVHAQEIQKKVQEQANLQALLQEREAAHKTAQKNMLGRIAGLQQSVRDARATQDEEAEAQKEAPSQADQKSANLYDQHKKQIEGLEQKIKDMQATEKSKIEEVAKAAAIGEKLRLQTKDKEIAKLRKQIETLQQSAQEAEEKHAASKNENDEAMAKELTGFETKLEQVEKIIAEEAATKAQHEKEIAELQKQLKEAQSSGNEKAASATAEHDKEVQELRKQLEDAQSKSSEEAGAKAAHEKEIADLKKQLEAAQSQGKEDTASANANHEKEIAELQKQLKEAQSQGADTSTAANDQHDKEMEALKAQLQEAQSSLASKTEELAQAAAAAKAKHEEELKELQECQESLFQQMQAKVAELNKEAEDAKEKHASELADLQQTIELLQSAPPDEDDEFHDAM